MSASKGVKHWTIMFGCQNHCSCTSQSDGMSVLCLLRTVWVYHLD